MVYAVHNMKVEIIQVLSGEKEQKAAIVVYRVIDGLFYSPEVCKYMLASIKVWSTISGSE